MSFVIACTKGGKTYGVSSFDGSFDLIPLDSNSALSKVHNYPQRVIANKILNWIQDNNAKGFGGLVIETVSFNVKN